MFATTVPQSQAVAFAEADGDPHFGQDSKLRDGARRLSSSDADLQAWHRIASPAGPVARDRAVIEHAVEQAVRYDDLDLQAVRGWLDALLLPRPGTAWAGMAHLREQVHEISREYSLRRCWEQCAAARPHPLQRAPRPAARPATLTTSPARAATTRRSTRARRSRPWHSTTSPSH